MYSKKYSSLTHTHTNNNKGLFDILMTYKWSKIRSPTKESFWCIFYQFFAICFSFIYNTSKNAMYFRYCSLIHFSLPHLSCKLSQVNRNSINNKVLVSCFCFSIKSNKARNVIWMENMIEEDKHYFIIRLRSSCRHRRSCV